MKRLMVSMLGNRIYLTNIKQDKDNPKISISSGKKEDYTDEAIRAVFEWFMNECKRNEPNQAYEIRFPSTDYVLTMRKERKRDINE